MDAEAGASLGLAAGEPGTVPGSDSVLLPGGPSLAFKAQDQPRGRSPEFNPVQTQQPRVSHPTHITVAFPSWLCLARV